MNKAVGKATLIGMALACGLMLLHTSCEPGPTRIPGYLHLRLNSNPTTLDPALISDVLGGTIAAKLFNGLVRFNEQLDILPDLAVSWKLSGDRRTYIFRLRKGVTFSNGREVRAADFKYSIERILKPATKSPVTWVFERIVGAREMLAGSAGELPGVVALDPYTLSITLTEPFGPFLSLLGMTAGYVVPREAVEAAPEGFGMSPLGTGPYVLAEWKHGQSLTLAARKSYFAGPAKLSGIIYRVIPEDLTATMEFETGRLDALLIPGSEYRRFSTDPRWHGLIHGKPGLNTYYLGLNCSRPPFDDARVRRAMNMAVDRQRILDKVFEKRGVLATGPIPPALWKFGEGPRGGDGYSYDPETARALIRKAGATGRKIKIYISAEQEVLDIVEVIQDYLAKVGIEASITQLDWSAYKQALNRGEADAFWLSWWADYPDPENYLFPLFHSRNIGPSGNRSRCIDRELDRIIERAQRTSDERARYRLYWTARERIVREAAWVFMWHRTDYYAVQSWVEEFRIYPIYSCDKGLDFNVKP